MQNCESVHFEVQVDGVHQVLKEGYGLENAKNLLLVCYVRLSTVCLGPSVQRILFYYLLQPGVWARNLGAAS